MDWRRFLKSHGISVSDESEHVFVLRCKKEGAYYYIYDRPNGINVGGMSGEVKIFYNETDAIKFKQENSLKKFYPASMRNVMKYEKPNIAVQAKRAQDLDKIWGIAGMNIDGIITTVHFDTKREEYIAMDSFIGTCAFSKKNAEGLLAEAEVERRIFLKILTFSQIEKLFKSDRREACEIMNYYYIVRKYDPDKYLYLIEDEEPQFGDIDEAYGFPRRIAEEFIKDDEDLQMVKVEV